MAIDPDVQVLLDALDARISGVEPPIIPQLRRVFDGESPQAAYDDLPPEGGVIELAPGRYDLGEALVLNRAKRAAFQGVGTGGYRQHAVDIGGAVLFSSAGADTLVSFQDPSTYKNAYGFEFTQLHFEISPTTTRVFDARAVNMMLVERCGFYHAKTDTVRAPFLVLDAYHDWPDNTAGDDSSWFRISDNYVYGGALIKATGFNVNQWVIRENIVFPKNSTDAMIYLFGAHRCVIRDNNLEGPTTGIHLEKSWACRLDGNGGEKTDPFILLDNSYGNLITDVGISYPGNKVFCRLTGNSSDNLIIAAVGTGMSNLYNHTDWISDETAQQKNWIIAPSKFTQPERLKLSGPIQWS